VVNTKEDAVWTRPEPMNVVSTPGATQYIPSTEAPRRGAVESPGPPHTPAESDRHPSSATTREKGSNEGAHPPSAKESKGKTIFMARSKAGSSATTSKKGGEEGAHLPSAKESKETISLARAKEGSTAKKGGKHAAKPSSASTGKGGNEGASNGSFMTRAKAGLVSKQRRQSDQPSSATTTKKGGKDEIERKGVHQGLHASYIPGEARMSIVTSEDYHDDNGQHAALAAKTKSAAGEPDMGLLPNFGIIFGVMIGIIGAVMVNYRFKSVYQSTAGSSDDGWNEPTEDSLLLMPDRTGITRVDYFPPSKAMPTGQPDTYNLDLPEQPPWYSVYGRKLPSFLKSPSSAIATLESGHQVPAIDTQVFPSPSQAVFQAVALTPRRRSPRGRNAPDNAKIFSI
jgi:hypothetical protein